MIDQLGPTTAAAPAASSPNEAERAKLKALAQQFESMLVSQMLREMRQSMVAEDGDTGLGGGSNGIMTDTMDSELGLALSKSGGLGLTNVLMKALDKQFGTGAAQPVAAPGTIAAPPPAAVAKPQSAIDVRGSDLASGSTAPVVASPESPFVSETGSDQGSNPTPDRSAASLPEGSVSSPFGWRSDPFTGQARFHAGTDIRMAYGQDVRAAAAGTVVSVGDRGGYGLTVVLDHGGGVQTKYAHLSAASLHPGDVVGTGQVIARSGNSGRSTGAHLHFEVLENGRAVDPTSAAGLLDAAGSH
jgi:murein DD-endopeptidase MepM/ murein hydrolase activator NlpD